MITVSGKKVPLVTQSLCVHGDRPNAPEIARAVRQRLEQDGVEVRSAFPAVTR